MKHGTSQITVYRYRALWSAYTQALRNPDIRTRDEAIRAAINSPQPRYMVSEEKMTRAISRLLKGQTPPFQPNGLHYKAMVDIYDIAKQLLTLPSFKGMSISFITAYAINTPAPCLFMSYHRARLAIAKIQKLRRQYRDAWSEHL